MDYREIQAILENEFSCDCSENEVRFQKAKNGVVHYYKQCLNCGTYVAVPKNKLGILFVASAVKPVDKKLSDDWREKINNRRTRLLNHEREKDNEAWFESYNVYLQSESWKKRRALVLQRDKNTCQACLSRQATQVHHTTYAHVFNEPLFELVSVCDTCHEIITKIDRD